MLREPVCGMVWTSLSYGHRAAPALHSGRNTFPSLCRGMAIVGASLGCLANMVIVCMLLNGLPGTNIGVPSSSHVQSMDPRRLAVVVPAHAGDMSRALASMSRWPKACSTASLLYMELVLYFAGDEDGGSWSDKALSTLTETGGKCFNRTSVLFADLSREDNEYPKGPSVQFYKLFLDDTIRNKMRRFEAIAIIEWDVTVAHEKSFERMYDVAFNGLEPYWIKGCSLTGDNFHETALMSEQQFILGHINGNAIYNNTDPAFVEFVEFTLARWEYAFSYDVAMWATIADFPYSWPLWQRFSAKFVNSNLIANVGFQDVSASTVHKAVEEGTMFIHGSVAGGGSHQYMQDGQPAQLGASSSSVIDCSHECESISIDSMSTVCDHTCLASENDLQGSSSLSCGAGDALRYGSHCRQCFIDVDEAVLADRLLHTQRTNTKSKGEHVIMCGTMRPPQSSHCSLECATNSDTVCDYRCGSGYVGDFNCNWRKKGPHCRFCFEDMNAAKKADRAAMRRGGRVIMCATLEPPRDEAKSEYALKTMERLSPTLASAVVKDVGNDHNAGRQMNKSHDLPADDEGLLPSTMPYATTLTRGDLCAFTLGYSSYLAETGAGVRSLAHFMPGMRVVVGVDPDNFAVFNSTLGIYPDVTVVNTTTIGGHASLFADIFCGEGTELIFYLDLGEFIWRAFTKKDTHGTNGDLLVRVTEQKALSSIFLKRSLATTSVFGYAAPSFSYDADIILPSWLNHRLRRVLLPGTDYGSKLVLGQTHLRDQIKAVSYVQTIQDAYVPELLAGLAYSMNSPGIWFIDPKQWVTRHAFQRESVWDIPLIKPRFGCSADLELVTQGYDVARELHRVVDSNGRRTDCQTGFLQLDISRLRVKAEVHRDLATGRARQQKISNIGA